MVAVPLVQTVSSEGREVAPRKEEGWQGHGATSLEVSCCAWQGLGGWR